MTEKNFIKEKIVITGIGTINPIASNPLDFWQNLSNGINGIDAVSMFKKDDLPVKIAGEVKDFKPEDYLEKKVARRTGRFAQLGFAAASQAIKDSNLIINEETRDNIGVIIATSGDAFNMGEEFDKLNMRGPSKVDPFIITRMGQHMAAARIGRELGVRGPNTTINTACASGTDVFGHAFNIIQNGQADALIVGGAESMISRLSLASMGRLGALSKNNSEPTKASRPFDITRDGFILGEGAGIVILESETYAKKRNAKIYAELLGIGWSFDATDDTAPDPEGQALAITRAMKQANINPLDVDYINAHGTSTQFNDKTETKAIKLALGEEQAYKTPLSSTKSMIGHLAAAAGSVEIIATLLSMQNNFIPPTINYEKPDPECDLDVVPVVGREKKIRIALSNSFGLGGQNACLALKKY
ncbi:MAG: beta-ketoacyl-[acyl-carrier-protein] synthase family protein [Dehalococcoidia bacterium]|jgi:3-oxoacyl-[acyl-carrier-protein] synthase II|nr:MAG: 3-oxoacyl-[acyl-carrier-protein] synthase II [Chloroflexota bacterium]|tara:strand:- start:8434 stop:9681 length:1248 start_codon:yes stop_codon:yes gene_type:complete